MIKKEYELFLGYCAALKENFRTIEGLSVCGFKEPLNLEMIYIPQQLMKKTMGAGNLLSGETDKNVNSLRETQREPDYLSGWMNKKEELVDADRALEKYRYLVVTGPPGSGKSVMLHRLTLKMCNENMDEGEVYRIPIPVTLREFARAKKSLRDHIDTLFAAYRFPKAKKYVEKVLVQDRCHLFLDGFDEITGNREQERVSQEIHKFIKKYPKIRVLVTSRETASFDERQGFTRLETAGFDIPRIKEFIDKWSILTGQQNAGVLSGLLMNNEKDISTFAQNPLMLTIIASCYRENEKIRPKRSDLYKRILDVFLGEWENHKNIKPQFSSHIKKYILKKIAFRNHSRRSRSMTEKEILEQIERYSYRFSFEKEKSGIILEELRQRNCILRRLSRDKFDFLHLEFQEYFAALELIEQEDGLNTIHSHLTDPWWEETILLHAGLSRDATRHIAVIQKNKPEDIFYSNLLLAGKCIAEAEFTDPFLKDEIIHELWYLYNISDFQLLKERIIRVLARLRPRHIIDELVYQLTDESPQSRQFAADTLGLIGSSEVLPSLIMVMSKDNESKIRSGAASAIGQIKNATAVPSLIHTLHSDKEGDVRRSSAAALGIIGNRDALPALFKSLTMDHDNNVRGSAAAAIGQIGSTESIPQLIRVLAAEKESSVRWPTASALGKLQGSDARDLFIEALNNDKDKEVRESAAEGLGLIGSRESITALIKALFLDDDADVRGSAAFALGHIKSKEALPALIKALLTDTDDEVRGRAAFALGRIKNLEAIPYLIAVFNNHKESMIRGNAAYALGEIGGVEALPFLIHALTLDKDSYVRYRAAEVLGSIGNMIAIQPLKTALEDEGSYYGWKVKDKAYEALEKISKRLHVRITGTENKGE